MPRATHPLRCPVNFYSQSLSMPLSRTFKTSVKGQIILYKSPPYLPIKLPAYNNSLPKEFSGPKLPPLHSFLTLLERGRTATLVFPTYFSTDLFLLKDTHSHSTSFPSFFPCGNGRETANLYHPREVFSVSSLIPIPTRRYACFHPP